MKRILILTLLFTACVSAQITVEGFLNEPFDKTIASVKGQNRDKKVEESDVAMYKGLVYYDWMEPISVRIGYLFEKDGKQAGKVLGNGKGNEEDAEAFFTAAKATLIKKYGTEYAESSMLGMTSLAWNHVRGCSVTLTRRKLKTTLTIFSRSTEDRSTPSN
jgi:hypothetical protein